MEGITTLGELEEMDVITLRSMLDSSGADVWLYYDLIITPFITASKEKIIKYFLERTTEEEEENVRDFVEHADLETLRMWRIALETGNTLGTFEEVLREVSRTRTSARAPAKPKTPHATAVPTVMTKIFTSAYNDSTFN
tara:strand:+ start:593 stop:1009 length:417 start_codon:yes stop_codon:yes gene_type:complete